MANDQSTAPRERINITYRPAGDPNNREVELPLRLLVIGDFGCNDENSTRPLRQRDKMENVDKTNFERILASANLSLDIGVEDTLTGSGAKLPVKLQFSSMKDFTPDRIIEQLADTRDKDGKGTAPSAEIDALSKLLRLRRALSALKQPLINNPQFRRKLQEVLDDPQQRAAVMRELGLQDG